MEPGHTCPYGWTDPTDALRFEKLRSRRQDTGVPCTVDEEEQVEFDQNDCDCCDRDRRAYPESLYASNELNHCHDADYDCNGKTEQMACCTEGHTDLYDQYHGGGGKHQPRTLWYASTCRSVDVDCGGCETNEVNAAEIEYGWACAESCGGDDDRKRTVVVPEGCPAVCGGECACVDAANPPMIGECAKFVVDCLQVRPTLFSDVEQCCVVTIT